MREVEDRLEFRMAFNYFWKMYLLYFRFIQSNGVTIKRDFSRHFLKTPFFQITPRIEYVWRLMVSHAKCMSHCRNREQSFQFISLEFSWPSIVCTIQKLCQFTYPLHANWIHNRYQTLNPSKKVHHIKKMSLPSMIRA